MLTSVIRKGLGLFGSCGPGCVQHLAHLDEIDVAVDVCSTDPAYENESRYSIFHLFVLAHALDKALSL